MSTRQSIPSKLRFEVFKRDKFICQYCGAKAPDVLLQVDHIHPVAEGGGNDILNLLTSCQSCNGGKGAVPLSDAAALDRQRDILADLETRRQQIEMMVRWRDELQSISEDAVSAIDNRIRAKSKYGLSEDGRADVRRWLKRFTVADLMHASDEAMDVYLRWQGDEPTSESWGIAFSKIPGVADIKRQEIEKPYLRRLFYIQGIIRNRSRARRYNCVEYLEHLVLCGADLDDMEIRAKKMRTLEDFEGPYDAWLDSLGRPF